MANKSLLQKPIFWAAIVGLGAAAYVATEPQASTGTGVKAAARKKATKPASKGVAIFTAEDEKAVFQPVNLTLKNSFVPVVKRGGGIGGADAKANLIPTDFTDGEKGWIYTGSAEVNGVANALLENTETGEGVFLKRNERWKAAAVISIGDKTVVMRGPNGVRTIRVVEEEFTAPAPVRMAQSQPQNNNGFSPMNPGLRGPIGSLPQVQGGQAIQVPGGTFTAAPTSAPEIIFNGN